MDGQPFNGILMREKPGKQARKAKSAAAPLLPATPTSSGVLAPAPKADRSVAWAHENMIRDLLPVVDHLEVGLRTAQEHKTESAVQAGFQLVYDQLIATLKKFGVTPLDAHEASFDPHLHEAVTRVPSAEYPVDEIIQQLHRGYKLDEKLLRPIQVVVSSGPGALRDDEIKAEET